jgi:rare lipoprotein A
MKSNNRARLAASLILPLTLVACGSFGGVDDSADARPAPMGERPAPDRSATAAPGVSDGVPKLGQPFTIDGVTHTPADVVDYDDVGFASWYGAEFAGRPTANGESFNPAGFTAAHKTLPLPSYVEVTALDTGRTILVRVNDRGPMDNSRIIDLSQAAAQMLGIADRPAAVRVRRVSPPESERAQLRAGQAVPERLPTPDSLLAILRSKAAALTPPRSASAVAVPAPRPVPSTPAPVADSPPRGSDRFIVEGAGSPAPPARATRPAPAETRPAPAAANAGLIVQVAAFGVKARADAAARKVGGTVVQGGNIWRVRLGPFADEAAAQSALASAKAKGYPEARIMRDR